MGLTGTCTFAGNCGKHEELSSAYKVGFEKQTLPTQG